MKVEITAEHKQIAESNGISQSVLYNRVRTRNWSIERAITEKPLDKDEIAQRGVELRKFNRSNGWSSDGGTLIRCPVEGCTHTGDIITKAHCRMVHGMEREEVKKKYGMPYKVKYREGRGVSGAIKDFV